MFPIALRSRCSWRHLEGLFRKRLKVREDDLRIRDKASLDF